MYSHEAFGHSNDIIHLDIITNYIYRDLINNNHTFETHILYFL